MNPIFWQLSNEQATFILNVLATRPFQEVNELINNLIRQSNMSQAAPQASPQPPQASETSGPDQTPVIN